MLPAGIPGEQIPYRRNCVAVAGAFGEAVSASFLKGAALSRLLLLFPAPGIILPDVSPVLQAVHDLPGGLSLYPGEINPRRRDGFQPHCENILCGADS